MNDTTALPEESPDPRFAERLEWQLRTALRRAERFAQPASRASARRGGLMVVLLAGALLLGAGSVLAARELRRSRAAELLAIEYQTRLEIAQLRVQAVGEELQELEQLHVHGVLGLDELEHARGELRAARLELSLASLDVFEVADTGREPDRRVSAPRVAGRDLVRERLELELGALRARQIAAAERAERLALLYQAGVSTSSETAQARLEEQRAADALSEVARRLQLRAECEEGTLAPARAELLGLQAAAQARLAGAVRDRELARTQLARTRALAQAGRTSRGEERQAERQLQMAEGAQRLAELELALLADRLEEQR